MTIRCMMDDKEAVLLFRKYSKKLYNTALRITLSETEAGDIMQETLIRYVSGNNLRDRDKEEAWLRTVCIRLAIDSLRRKKKFLRIEEYPEMENQAFSEEPDEEDESGLWTGLDGSMISVVSEEIGKLPAGYRMILTLKLIEGYEYSDISKMLGITESGARSQYMRGRKRLSDNLRYRLKSANEKDGETDGKIF